MGGGWRSILACPLDAKLADLARERDTASVWEQLGLGGFGQLCISLGTRIASVQKQAPFSIRIRAILIGEALAPYDGSINLYLHPGRPGPPP
jgi:hypothetical protein